MERREHFMKNSDWLRKVLITEPRGYPCQNVNVIYPPTPNVPNAAFSYVIGENNFVYPAMSGHNTICVVTALLETDMVTMAEPVTKFVLEAPAGAIAITGIYISRLLLFMFLSLHCRSRAMIKRSNK